MIVFDRLRHVDDESLAVVVQQIELALGGIGVVLSVIEDRKVSAYLCNPEHKVSLMSRVKIVQRLGPIL